MQLPELPDRQEEQKISRWEQHGLPLNIGLEVSSLDTLKRYVALGLGVAAVSGLCLTEDDWSQMEMIEVPADLGANSTYGMILRRDKHLTSPLETFVQLIKND